MEKLKKCSKCSRELPVSEFWKNASTEDGLQTYCKELFFSKKYTLEDRICNTITSKHDDLIHFTQPLYLSTSEICKVSTFPIDYNFCNQSPHYICGMSVPPVMMAHVASRVWKYWLSKL